MAKRRYEMLRRQIIIGVLLLFPSLCLGNSIAKRWGIGVNYPGLSIKYGIDSRNALELKYQFAEDIFVIGARYYHSFNPRDKAVIFMGGEGDYARMAVCPSASSCPWASARPASARARMVSSAT